MNKLKPNVFDVCNFQVLENHKGKAIGLDVSRIGTIDWPFGQSLEGKFPLEFVVICQVEYMMLNSKKFTQK
jgi:lysozyme